MREKLKSRKMRTILITIIILAIGIVSHVILSQDNKKESLSNLSDKEITKIKIDNKEKEKVEDLKVEEKGDESATEENKTEVSNTSKEKEKKETTSQSTTNTNDNNSRVSQEQTTNTNQSVKSETNSNNNNTQQQTNVIQNTTPEPVHEQTEWEKLGISEYDYYNSPMWSWARVDYKVSEYGSYESAHQSCINAGLDKQEKDENLISFSCTQINSYSGNTLGDMLRLKY